MAMDSSTKPATYYAGTDYTGVWKSFDGGASFTQTGLTGPRAGNVQVFSLDSNKSTHVLYAAGNGLFASLDGGTHFLPQLDILPGLEVNFVASDQHKPLPHVFAGTSGGWFTSSDGGFTFIPAKGLPSHTVVFGGAVDESDGLVFATTSKGVFSSNDSGPPSRPRI